MARKTKRTKKANNIGPSESFFRSIGYIRKVKPEPAFIKSEIPKTKEFIQMEKDQVIEDILEGKLHLFLRRYYRMSRAPRTYSKLIPEYNQELSTRRAIKWVRRKLEWPTHITEVINILRTLEKYYDAEFNRPNMETAYEIWELFADDEIQKYLTKLWTNTCNRRPWNKVKKLTKKQAWAEQQAMGYIHVNDFEDYDKKAAHAYSNIKRQYLYPMNFYHGTYKNYNLKTHIHIGLGLVGVQGYTRCVIPD